MVERVRRLRRPARLRLTHGRGLRWHIRQARLQERTRSRPHRLVRRESQERANENGRDQGEVCERLLAQRLHIFGGRMERETCPMCTRKSTLGMFLLREIKFPLYL